MEYHENKVKDKIKKIHMCNIFKKSLNSVTTIQFLKWSSRNKTAKMYHSIASEDFKTEYLLKFGWKRL